MLEVFAGVWMFVIPMLVLAFFMLGLLRYWQTRKQEKANPGSVLPEVLKERKIFFIAFSVILGLFLAVLFGAAGCIAFL